MKIIKKLDFASILLLLFVIAIPITMYIYTNIKTDMKLFTKQVSLLNNLEVLDKDINMFSIQKGISYNYDHINSIVNHFDKDLQELKKLSSNNSNTKYLLPALDSIKKDFQTKVQHLEHIKSYNASTGTLLNYLFDLKEVMKQENIVSVDDISLAQDTLFLSLGIYTGIQYKQETLIQSIAKLKEITNKYNYEKIEYFLQHQELIYKMITTIKEEQNALQSIDIFKKHLQSIDKLKKQHTKNHQLTNYTMLGILTVSMLFALLILFLHQKALASKEQLLNGIEEFKINFTKYVEYITRKSSRYEHVEVKNSTNIGVLTTILNDAAKDYKAIIDQDNKVLNQLSHISNKVAEGKYNNKLEYKGDASVLQSVVKSINKLIIALNQDMNLIKDTLSNYSQNNYSVKVDIPYDKKAEIREVMEAINSLGDMLANSAKNNLEHGKILTESSTMLSTSMQKLAKKVSQQALSIEETTKNVENIEELTNKNTNYTTQMANLGQKVKQLSITGQELSKDTEVAMNMIIKETQKIEEFVNIIDNISFQTNVLSLNAAVESAKAGEYGRGFSVVASEVRTLATKTIDAATTIKELLKNSLEKTYSGKITSDKMTQGYIDLNKHIAETINLIQNVESSSHEQLQGVKQISDIIHKIDDATQENATEVNQVSMMSKDVDKIAQKLVADASAKQF